MMYNNNKKDIELFDLPDFQDQDFQCNPYPYYAAARKEHPVFWSPRHRQYFVLSADALHHVMVKRDFIVDTPFRASRILFGRTVMDVDGEEHTRLRSIINGSFVPARYDDYVENIVRPVIQEQLAPLRAKNGGDFIGEFANHIPTKVMSQIIGIPVQDYREFFELTLPIIRYLDVANRETLVAAKASMTILKKMVITLCDQQRSEPDNSVIGGLIQAQRDGASISDDEIIRQIGLLIPAAIDTTNRLIGNALYLLTQNPEWQARLREQHALLPAFVEEVMRFEPPIHSSVRICKKSVSVLGVELEQGALLNINFAAANRDESRFDNPNEFNPLRANVKRHFSFGGGKHQCMGRLLATREVIEVLQAVLADARQLTFASGYSPAIEGVAFRSPAQLHLQWK